MRPFSRRRVLAAVVAALAVTAAVPAYADHDNGKGKSQDHEHAQGPKKPKPSDPCRDDRDDAFETGVWVNGQWAPALVALPRQKPRGIVVFDHGYGHTMESWRAHAARVAAQHQVIAIAPEYRNQVRVGVREGSGLPISTGWRVVEGAEDTIAFAREYERLCNPKGTNVVYGVSMGGNTSGLALAAKPKRMDEQSPLFDYWVDVEGAVNVTETYLGAVALAGVSGTAAQAQKDIEAAFGGSLLEKPQVYAQNTVVARAADIAAAGLKGVYVVHGVADGLVSHDHSRQLQALLRARGVRVDMWSAVTRKKDTEAGTTIDGYVHDGAKTGQTSPFAGHASETSMNHVVGLAGFAALDRIYAGTDFTCGEAVYDGTANDSVRLTTTGC